ncbi:MAG: formylglycine-generating enzyme family protein [Planctomycetota bacterium]
MKRINTLVLFTALLMMASKVVGDEAVVKPHSRGPAASLAGRAQSLPAVPAGQKRSDNGLSMQLVWCPPGSFLMGSHEPAEAVAEIQGGDDEEYEDEQPQHRVILTEGFWIGKCEVTQAEWISVMGTRPWGPDPYASDRPGAAATYIAWHDAAEFCRRLTAREQRSGRLPASERYTLPTEAQWEYACRAGTSTRWSFGDSDEDLSDHAWSKTYSLDHEALDLLDLGDNDGEINPSDSHDVGKKLDNAWGLHDTHGNVCEWCQDWYNKQYYQKSPGVNPQGPASGEFRVLRGGAWTYGPAETRSAARLGTLAGNCSDDIGFRVALVKATQSGTRQSAIKRSNE